MNEKIFINADQKEALLKIFAWLSDGKEPVFRLGGYAGTGKSTLLAVVRLLIKKKRPEWKVAFASFTGKATRVLATKLKENKAQFSHDNLSTLHALLYSPMIDIKGQISGWRRKVEVSYQLLIIDEASMVTAEIWDDIKRLGIPVLAVGDHGQLPPVNSKFSLMEEPDFVLTHIHRQAAHSPILEVARMARNQGFIPIEQFGPGVEKFNAQNSDAQILIDEFMQNWNSDTLLLSGFNTTRNRLNASVRAAQWRNASKPEAGDQVVCLKNDWQEGIFNGMTGILQSIVPVRPKGDELLSYEAEVIDDEGKVLYSGKIAAQQFGAAESMKFGKKEQKSIGQLFDYGYCLTVHKAQGSQAPRVILIEERSKHMDDEEWKRWLYTGVTRAEKELYIFGKG